MSRYDELRKLQDARECAAREVKDAQLTARREAAAALEAQRLVHLNAITDAASRCKDEPTEASFEDLAAEVVAAKAFCEPLGPVQHGSGTVPRQVGFAESAFISLPQALLAGYCRIEGLSDSAAREIHWGELTGWGVNHRGTTRHNPVRLACQHAIDNPNAATLELACWALANYAESFEYGTNAKGGRYAICKRITKQPMQFREAYSFNDRPDTGFAADDMLAHVADIVFTPGAKPGPVFRNRF